MQIKSILLTCLFACVLCFACGEETGTNEDYKDNLPDWDALNITLPEAVKAKFKTSENQIAKSYTDAVAITKDLNPILYYLLAVVDEIVANPPSRTEGNNIIWEASEPLSGLSAVIPRFTLGEMEVEGVMNHTYTFELRHKNDSADSFVKVWWGLMAPDSSMARRGAGQMTIDFDAAKSVDPATMESGLVVVDYDIRVDVDRSIDIYFEDFHADNAPDDTVLNATYNYLDAKDLSGMLKLSAFDEQYMDEGNNAVCLIEFDVNWQSNGAGQSTVTVSECDIEDGIDKYSIDECWNDSFYRTYYSALVYWDKDNPPSWANENMDNPIQDQETLFGDIEECPADF